MDYEEKVGKNYAEHGMQGNQYSWSQGETLIELLERKDEILVNHQKALERSKKRRTNVPLVDVLADALNEDDDTLPCQVCNM